MRGRPGAAGGRGLVKGAAGRHSHLAARRLRQERRGRAPAGGIWEILWGRWMGNENKSGWI
jgi:hypothetical protein